MSCCAGIGTGHGAEVGGPTGPDAGRRALLGRRAQLLAGASVAYNVVEAVVAIAAGAAASSIALIGFGLDSTVEVASGLVILWQFRHPVPESREARALRLIGISFFALATYVAVDSVIGLLGGRVPETSLVGLVITGLSVVIMPLLSWAQLRTGRELASGSVVADSRQTMLCTYLSVAVLLGLLANTLLGWWWADGVAGLLIAAVAVREGAEAWRGEACGCGPAAAPAAEPDSCCTGVSADAGAVQLGERP